MAVKKLETVWRPLRVLLAAGLLVAGFHTVLVAAAAPDTDALRDKYPEYRTALTALGDEEFQTAIDALSKLAASGDPNLAADATFFLGRGLVLQERYEEALSLFTKIAGPLQGKTTHVGEAIYMRGLCEAKLMKRKEAIASFDSFLSGYKDAPERMRVDASRQLSELKQIKQGSIEDIQQHMDYSRRRLALEDAGQATRARQDKIVTMLAKLIEEQEKDDDNSNQKQQKNSGSKQQSKSSQKSSQKTGNSGRNPGGNRTPSGNDVIGKFQTGGRNAFGEIPDHERRERIYGALKTRLPPQDRQLIEQYYKNLQEDRP